MTLEEKRRREHETVATMISIYCRGIHHSAEQLCPQCQALADYVKTRIDRCPHMADKTFCSACKTHCYAPAQRRQIQEVMHYSGPRMIFRSPFLALYHLYIQCRQSLKIH